VYEPKGQFGGYEHTFPKGGLEKGLTPQQNAHKELWEETGLHAQITGFVGDFEGTTSTSRYYLATRIGGEPHAPDPTPFVKGGSETAEVKRLSPEEAAAALNTARDQAILERVLDMPVPETAEPGSYPLPAPTTALTYPLLDGEVREQKFSVKGDAWGGPSSRLGEHYMTDALVANWDFVGLTRDNVLWQDDGGDEPRPVRLDQGGTFQYRAQGAPKPFGPVPTEVWTMRSPKGQGFGTVRVSEAEMRDQAGVIGERLTDERVDALLDQAPFADEQMREEIRENFKARVQWMREFARAGSCATARRSWRCSRRSTPCWTSSRIRTASCARWSTGICVRARTRARPRRRCAMPLALWTTC
jgi:ADP-ribose pyrophosphatase YjhB (NUDIX family)